MLTVYTEDLKMKLGNLVKSEKGQGLVEYALILFVIAVAAVAMLGPLRDQISTVFGTIVTALGG